MCPGHGRCGYGGPSTGSGRPSSGRAVRVRHPLAVGAGVRAWGPSTVPLACMPCGGLRPAGVVRADPWEGGLPSLRGTSGVLRSPSPGRPSLGTGGQDPLPVCPGHAWCGPWGTQHGPHSVRSCEPALRALGVAGGRPRGGCLASL